MSDKGASSLGSEGSKVPGNISWYGDSEGSFNSAKRPGPGESSDQPTEKRLKRTLGRRSEGTPHARGQVKRLLQELPHTRRLRR